MAEQPPAKRLKVGDSADSDACHDLSIIIEGETMSVHSQFLKFVSPVFRRMLDSGMAESRSNEVSLPGKKKEEFLIFMQVIEPLSDATVNSENALFLARWADEYGIEGLRKRCEDKLMTLPVSVANLQLAVECNLDRCAEKCFTQILLNIHSYMADLVALGSSFPEDMLRRLWPAMAKAAGADESAVPETGSLESLLPVMKAAADSSKRIEELEQQLAAKDLMLGASQAREKRMAKTVEKIKTTVKSWPDALAQRLVLAPGNKASVWLKDCIQKLPD
mmetsp:Transcript_54476/g.100744  ORF Transcript_54476/g.100744 Transcript_54476/m.100744 type:complete len:277 (-) Transcript_54476:79-909(-)